MKTTHELTMERLRAENKAMSDSMRRMFGDPPPLRAAADHTGWDTNCSFTPTKTEKPKQE